MTEEEEIWNGQEGETPEWEEEEQDLSTSNDTEYFKAPSGQTKIKFLSEGTIYETQKEWDDQKQKYFRVPIEVDGERKIWEMKKATTANSKYGQIVRYARLKKGLEGEEITLYRQGTGKESSYIIMGLEQLEREKGITKYLEEEN